MDALVRGAIVPQAAPEQFVPETDQITPRFKGSFVTVATIGNVLLISTEPVIGEIATEAGTTAPPIDMVIWPTTVHFAAIGQLMVI